MVAPTWAQIKIGPLLRGETDRRTYHNLFIQRHGDVRGPRKAWLRFCAGKLGEPESLDTPASFAGSRNGVVTFEGWQDYFARLNGWDEWLHRELRAITRTRWLAEADSVKDVPIAINVRCGDFAVARTPEDLYTKGGIRTPIAWFVDSLRAVREAAATRSEAYVVSDGTDQELAPLLACDNVVRFRPGSAISGLLFLARARVLIGAGGSSFSAWASFLGQMPTISHPGQSLTWFKLTNSRGRYLGEFNPAKPNPAFIAQVESLLAPRDRPFHLIVVP